VTIDENQARCCRQQSSVGRMSERRSRNWRATSVILLATVLMAGCAPTGGTAIPSASTSGSSGHGPPSFPPADERECEEVTTDVPTSHPQDWVGVRWSGAGQDYDIVHWNGKQSVTMEQFKFRTPVEGASLPEDIVLDDGTGMILYALCCEAAGTLLAVNDPERRHSDQGHRVDVLGGTNRASLLARVDRFGTVVIRPAFPSVEREFILAGAQAADITIAPDASVLVLVDPSRVEKVNDSSAGPGVMVLQQGTDCDWTERRIPLESGPYCSLVALRDGQVGLVRAPATWRADEHQACHGDTLDVLTIASGHVTPAALVFPVSLAHLSSDDSGNYLIATGTDGSVRWYTMDGSSGQLAKDSYIAADW